MNPYIDNVTSLTEQKLLNNETEKKKAALEMRLLK